MAKLYVAVVGLINIIKNGRLLITRTAESDTAGPYPIPIHSPMIRFRSGGVTVPFPLNDHRVEIQIGGSGRFEILRMADFLDFDDFLDANGDVGTVDSSCVTGSCAAAAGRCILPHGRLSPVEAYMDGVTGPIHVSDEITAKLVGRFRPTVSQTRYDVQKDKVASGALFETTVDEAGVSLKLNSDIHVLEPGPLDAPRVIERPTSENDYIIWVENLPDRAHDPRDEDIHFFLLYNFLRESDTPRWVPVIEVPEGKVLPGSQCITPIKG